MSSAAIAQETLDGTAVTFDVNKVQAEKLQPPGAFTPPAEPIMPDPMISYGPWSGSSETSMRNRERILKALRHRGSFGPNKIEEPFEYTEEETTPGENNDLDTAEKLPRLNVGFNRRNRTIISGSLGDLPVRDEVQIEPDGSISLALDSGITSAPDGIRFSGVIGDAPGGPGVPDFDFVKVTVPAGVTFDINVRTPEPFLDLDPFVALFLEDGTLIFTQDDGGDGFDTSATLTVGAADLTFYLSIGGFGAFFPADATDPNSGSVTGAVGSQGTYDFELRVFPEESDVDVYKLKMRKGDVLGMAARVAGTPTLRIFNDDLEFEKGVTGIGTFAVPASPLPIDGSGVIDYVVEETGNYRLELSNAFGEYELEVGVYSPGFDEDPRRVQLIWLDYNGGPVDKQPWFGFEFITDHTPFRDFLPAWGLPSEEHDVRRITKAITAEVKDNLDRELRKSRENRRFKVVVLGNDGTGTPHPLEPYIEQGSFEFFGVTYEVSVLEISGTTGEAFINTIGIASEIDPGNYSAQDAALVLLDVLSAPATGFSADSTFSLNDVVLGGGATKEELVTTALGNVTAHEAGHYLGNFHTDGVFSDVASIMDEGPGGLFNLAGIGPSGIFGEADTVDVSFIDDTYSILEGFDGDENTTVNTAFALSFSFFGW